MNPNWGRKPVLTGFVAAQRQGFSGHVAGGLPGVTQLDRPAGGSGQTRNDFGVDASSFSAIERQASHSHSLGRVGAGFRQMIRHCLFATVAGHPQAIRATWSRFSGFPHRMRPCVRPRIRDLLPSSE